MELNFIQSNKEINEFIRFGRFVYTGNPCYRDSMSGIVSMFLYHKTCYLKNGKIFPILIRDRDKTLLRAAYVINNKMPDILMIAFFEAAPGAGDAVQLMLSEGRKIAAGFRRKSIVVGLDAHLNYGVGFLASHFDVDPCFGFPYTHNYYLDYFKDLKEHRFTSFQTDIACFNLDQEQRILKRLKSNGYSFRPADFKFFDRELKIYTDLNNICFKNHLWWADRSYEEDHELLYPFRRFIRGENLLIAEKEGKPIGFMLWYPDFNQLIAPGKSLNVSTWLKYKLGRPQKINKIKIAEIGIKPEYQGTGAVVGLFDLLYKLVKDKYRYCEAGWVEENNIKSKGLGLHWARAGCREYKKYKAFEVQL